MCLLTSLPIGLSGHLGKSALPGDYLNQQFNHFAFSGGATRYLTLLHFDIPYHSL